jgi:uncharacterized membrane protein
MIALGLVAGTSIFISLVFWVMGAPWVLPFALVETLVLATAFVFHARTRRDFDEVTCNERHVFVRQERGGRVKEHQFTRGLCRVDMTRSMRPLVRLNESGRYVDLGEWMLPQDRLSLCRQLTHVAALP